MDYSQFLSLTVFENTVQQYIVALGWLIIGLLVLKIFQKIIIVRLESLAKKTRTDFDDTLIEIVRNIRPPFYVIVALYFALHTLQLSQAAQTVITVLFTVTLVYEVVTGLDRLTSYAVGKYLNKNTETPAEEMQNASVLRMLSSVARVTYWVIGVLMILSNLGVNITSIIASLGVGGIAVALAAQKIFEDLFSAVAIYFDKPFQVGDFIVVGDDMGVVQKIGMKTTRLQTLQGEELVIPNKELTAARVQNFKRMERRRVVFSLGVTYDTPQAKVEAIPEMVQEIIGEIEHVEFDRCHFNAFGDSSLLYEVVYYINSADYNQHMDTLQQINRHIYQRFNKEKISFAYPTQTVIVEKSK